MIKAIKDAYSLPESGRAALKLLAATFVASYIVIMQETGTKFFYDNFNAPAQYDGVDFNRRPPRANRDGSMNAMMISMFLMFIHAPIALLLGMPATKFLMKRKWVNPLFMLGLFVGLGLVCNYTIYLFMDYEGAAMRRAMIIVAAIFWSLYFAPWAYSEKISLWAPFRIPKRLADRFQGSDKT